MTARLFDIADNPTALPPHSSSITSKVGVIIPGAELIRLRAELQRLQAFAQVVLVEYDRGGGTVNVLIGLNWMMRWGCCEGS